MRSLKRILAYHKKYWKLSVPTILLIVFVEMLQLVLPRLQGYIIGTIIKWHQWDRLMPFVLMYFVAGAGHNILAMVRTLMYNNLGLKVSYDIRNRLFDHIQRLSFSYHDEAETGQLLSRMTEDVETVRTFMSVGTNLILAQFVMFFGAVAVLIYMNWKLALASLSVMPFLFVAAAFLGRKIGPLFAAVQQQGGVMTTAIQQNLMGIRVVKAFAREDYETRKFGKQAYTLLERHLDTNRTMSFFGPMMDFFAAFGVTFVLSYGGYLVIHKELEMDELISFMLYMGYIVWPVRMIGWVTAMTKNAIAGSDRIHDVLDTHREIDIKDGKLDLKKCDGCVEFKDVCFTYADGSTALSGINIKVEPGEMVAIMGGTGSGKSTLINLLPRFYDATSGSIMIDGTDVRQYKLKSLREKIGIVSQEPFLFGDTIYENIAYARPDVPLDDVIDAAKTANIHDFIMTLPEQYESRIGERGVNLSGGQKQRVAIARALLMNPPILILDDATSSVDTETEAMIQQALSSLMQARTTFVIAQRVSTVKRADKIIVLDKGRIVEFGKHDELIQLDGLYSEIFQLQFGAQLAEVNDGTRGI